MEGSDGYYRGHAAHLAILEFNVKHLRSNMAGLSEIPAPAKLANLLIVLLIAIYHALLLIP